MATTQQVMGVKLIAKASPQATYALRQQESAAFAN
jgi:hypothetical protein